MNIVYICIGELSGECIETRMHGAGPLAMVSPIHGFEHSRLTRQEEDNLATAAISSHVSSAPPPPPPPRPESLPLPLPEAHPPFTDPTEQALFEADKRQIYK